MAKQIEKTSTLRRSDRGEIMISDRTEDADLDACGKASALIKLAVEKKKLKAAYDTIAFDRRGRADGGAIHHEVYDISPDGHEVVICIRTTEGGRYGVKTISKSYYLVKKTGRTATVTEIDRGALVARTAKAAGNVIGRVVSKVNK